MKKFNVFNAVLAVMLVLVMAFMTPAQVFAASNNGKYVSEVYVAYGKDAEEAKKTLQDKGFTPVEGNLNDGGKTYSMLGYKTTNDIRESITDLAVMNMNGDYSVEEYKNFLKKQKTQIAEFLEEFMAVIQEYRANLKAGETKAIYVHDALNNFIEDDTGMKMGDLLNSVTLQDKVGIAESIEAENPDKLPDLVTILLQGNAQVIKTIEVLLSMATDASDNTWLDRFAEKDYDDLLDELQDTRPDLNTLSKRIAYLENIYGEDAGALAVGAAGIRSELEYYENSEIHIDTATEEDIINYFGDINESLYALKNYQEWLVLGTIYEYLKNYEGGNFAKGEMLDFFLEEKDAEETDDFIPIAAALSEGQRAGIPFVSFMQLLTYTIVDNEGWKQYTDKATKGFDGFDTVSVYQNIDRDIYKDDGSVALTGAAQRANNTADGTTGTIKEKNDTIGMIAALSWACTGALGLATYMSYTSRNIAVNAYNANPFQVYKNAVYDNNAYKYIKDNLPEFTADDVVYPMNEPDAVKKLATLEEARFAVALSRILTIATVVLAVASAVLTVIALLQTDEYEQLPIPMYLVDNYADADGGSYSLNYKAVECNREEYFGEGYTTQKGNCADLNADEGKQWLVLYASKNSKAGRPLQPDFVAQEDSEAPLYYEGCVHLFGEKGAVNVVSGAFKNYSGMSSLWQTVAGKYKMHIFYRLSKDVKTYNEASGNMTASAIGSGNTAIFGFGGLAIGAILGAVCTAFVNKNKKKKTAE